MGQLKTALPGHDRSIVMGDGSIAGYPGASPRIIRHGGLLRRKAAFAQFAETRPRFKLPVSALVNCGSGRSGASSPA